jgi:integrase
VTPDIAKNLVPTYTVISRHSASCPDRSKGITSLRCDCKKWIRVYDPRIADPKKRQTHFLDAEGRLHRSPISTKTRSAVDAEKIAQEYRDQYNPDKRARAEAEAKLKAVQSEKESKTVLIEKAVAMFLASKRAEGLSRKRIERYLPLLGDVDSEALTFKRNRRGNEGHLSEWLKALNPRPLYVSDLTPELIQGFRNSWNYGSDLTYHVTFGDLKCFFNYCRDMKWIQDHPMVGMKAPKVKRGNRTTAFSDPQCDSIVDAIKRRFPEEIKTPEDKKQHEDTHRLLAFVELARWGGLAVIDVIKFKLSTMKDNGEVRYIRQKTGKEAKPTLLPHVVDLLKTTVPVDGDFNQPFYDDNVDPDTNIGRWWEELKTVFVDAGIKSVKTQLRERNPHAHMFRDTFAVGQLRTQYKLGRVNHQAIADALGDTVAVFLKHYKPWIDELEQAHKDEQRQIVDVQAAELAAKQASKDKKVVNIGRSK